MAAVVVPVVVIKEHRGSWWAFARRVGAVRRELVVTDHTALFFLITVFVRYIFQ